MTPMSRLHLENKIKSTEKCLHGDLFRIQRMKSSVFSFIVTDCSPSLLTFSFISISAGQRLLGSCIMFKLKEKFRACECVSSLLRGFNLDVNILVWHHSCDNRCVSCQHFHFLSESESEGASHTWLGIIVNVSLLNY